MIDDMMDDLADYGIQVPKAKDVVKSKKSKQGKRGKKGSDTKLTRGSKKQTKKSSTYGGGDAKEADKISIEGESTVTMSENSSKKERSNASEPKLSKADSKKDSKTRRRLRIPQGIK